MRSSLLYLILRNYRTFTLTQNIKCCRRPGHVALSFEFFFLLDINPKMTPFQHNYRRERKKRPFPPLSPASHLQWRDIKIDLNSTFLNTPSVSLWDFLSSLVTRYFFSLLHSYRNCYGYSRFLLLLLRPEQHLCMSVKTNGRTVKSLNFTCQAMKGMKIPCWYVV